VSRGKAWEAQLLAHHADYERARTAYIVHAPPPVRVISKKADGTFIGKWFRSGPCDFAGSVRGRAVIFDAKDCAADRWPLAKLETHQALGLERAQRTNAYAFVALRLPWGAYVLPWSRLRGLWDRATQKTAKRGEYSLDLIALQKVGRRMETPGDWLPVVLAELGEP